MKNILNRLFLLLSLSLLTDYIGAAAVEKSSVRRDNEGSKATADQQIFNDRFLNAVKKSKSEEVHKLLEQKKVNVNGVNYQGCTALMQIGLGYGNNEVAKILLQHNADPNIQDKCGYTALMAAVKNQAYEFGELLLKHGARVNLQNHYQDDTALTLAASSGDCKFVELLLKHEANPELKNAAQQTALIQAIKLNNDPMKALLERYITYWNKYHEKYLEFINEFDASLPGNLISVGMPNVLIPIVSGYSQLSYQEFIDYHEAQNREQQEKEHSDLFLY